MGYIGIESISNDRLLAQLNNVFTKDKVLEMSIESFSKWLKSQIEKTTNEVKNAEQNLKELQNQYNKISSDSFQKINTADENKAFEDLLAKYKDNNTKILDIEKSFGDDLKKLKEKRGNSNDAKEKEKISDTIKQLEKDKEKKIKEVNNAEYLEAKKNPGILANVFSDASLKSASEINALYTKGNDILSYVSKTDKHDLVDGFGMSKEALQGLKDNPAEINAMSVALDKLFKKGVEKNPFAALGAAIGKIFDPEQNSDANTTENNLMALGEAATKSANMVGSLAGQLSTMFAAAGNDEAAAIADSIQGIMTSVSNIAGGFAKGGIVGGVAAVVGEGISIITNIFQSEARHQAAIKAINDAKIAAQRQYNLLLFEQNMLMSQYSNIFGENQIAKAKGYVEQYAIATSSYNEALGKLSSAKVVTGHEKTGWFGWGKGKDVYSGILEAYPQIINKATGALDKAALKSAMANGKMSEQTKADLQNILDWDEALKESEDALNGYLQSTFGKLGGGLMDSITSSLKGGEDALESFADKAASIIEELIEQVAYAMFFEDKFNKLEADLKDIYETPGLSEEQIAKRAQQKIAQFYNNIGADIDKAEAFMEMSKAESEKQGIDIFQNGGSAQSGRSGSFSTMSQEQGTKLEGLFTSVQMHISSVDMNVENIALGLGSSLDSLGRIVINTDPIPFIYNIMQEIKRDGLKMR